MEVPKRLNKQVVRTRLDREDGRLDRYIIPTFDTYSKLVDDCNPEAVFAAAKLQ